MTATLARRRKSAYAIQSGRCYYCCLPMWENNPECFARTHNITLSQAQLLKCTAEHLEAKQDGGNDTTQNIVAACRWCNSKRHARKKAPDPIAYQQLVRHRLSSGRWHAEPILKICKVACRNC